MEEQAPAYPFADDLRPFAPGLCRHRLAGQHEPAANRGFAVWAFLSHRCRAATVGPGPPISRSVEAQRSPRRSAFTPPVDHAKSLEPPRFVSGHPTEPV